MMESEPSFIWESIEDLKVENFLLRSKLESHQDTFQQLSFTSSLNKEKVEEYRKKLEESSQHEEAQNQLLRQIRKDLEEKNSMLPVLESELKLLKEAMIDNDEKSKFEVELFLLKSKLSSYEKHIEELESVMKETLENQTLRHEEQVTKKSMEHDQHISGLKQQLKDSFEQMEKMKQEMTSLQNLLEESKNSTAHDNEKSNDLEVELFLAKSKLDSYQRHLFEMETKMTSMTTEAAKNLERMERGCQETKNGLKAKVKKLEEKNSMLPVLESELKLLKEAMIDNDEKSEFEVELFLLKSKLSSYEKHIEELESVMKETLENQTLRHEEQVTKKSMEHDQHISGLKQQLKDSFEQMEKMKQEMTSLQNLLEESKNSTAHENEKSNDLEVELFIAKSKLDSYQRNHFEMETKMTSMTTEAAKNLERMERGCQETNNGLKAKVMQLQNELNTQKEAESDLESKKSQLERMKSEIDCLKDELTKSTNKSDVMEAQLFIIRSKLLSSEQAFDEMKSSMEQSLSNEKLTHEKKMSLKEKEHKIQMLGLQNAIEESLCKVQHLQEAQVLQQQKNAFSVEEKEAVRKLEQERDELAVNVLLLESKLSSYKTSHGQMLELLNIEKEKIKVLSQQNSSLLNHLDKEKSCNKDVSKLLETELLEKNQLIYLKEQTIGQLKEAVQDQRFKHDKLEEDFFECRQELLNLRNNSDDEKNQLNILAEKLDGKEAYIADLQCQLEKLTEKIDQLMKVDESSKVVIEEAKQAQDQLEETMASMKAENQALISDLAEAKATLTQFTVSFEVEKIAAEVAFHSEMEKLEAGKLKELEVMQEKCRLSASENETFKKHIHELEAKVMKNEADKGVSQAELTSRNEVISKLEAEIHSYKGQLCTKETCISALVMAKDETDKKLCVLEKESEADKESISKLQTDLGHAKSINATLQEKLIDVNENLESQILDKIAAEEEIENLKEENEDLKPKNQSLTVQLNEAVSSKAQLETEMKNWQNESDEKITLLQKEMKETLEKKETLEQEKIDLTRLLEEKEAEFMKSLDELEQDLSVKAKDCQETQSTCQQLKEENEILDSNVKALKLEIETTKNDHNESSKKVENLTKDLETTRKEKESKTAKLRLLLSNQKKLEKDYQELQKVSDEMKVKLQDKAALEAELQAQKKKAAELEADLAREKNGDMDDPESLPWNADPELKDLTPSELRAIIGKDLTGKEKAKLNEMCLLELEKELKLKISAESGLYWEISSLKKELEKYKIMLEQSRTRNAAAKAALLSSEENDDEKRQQQLRSTKATKRRSSPLRIMTRSSTSSKNDLSEEQGSSPAVKKSRRDHSSKDLISKMNGQENDARSMASSKRKSRLASIQLDKAMPTNPYKKSSESSKIGNKKPLETITNQS